MSISFKRSFHPMGEIEKVQNVLFIGDYYRHMWYNYVNNIGYY